MDVLAAINVHNCSSWHWVTSGSFKMRTLYSFTILTLDIILTTTLILLTIIYLLFIMPVYFVKELVTNL